jgi:urease accessory protein
MHRASIHRSAGRWPKEKSTGSLTLDFDSRHRRRIRLSPNQHEEILLDLPKAVAMADGDGLQLDDGSWLEIRAAAESVVEIRHDELGQLVRIAWHLGNRHLPTEVRNDALRIRPDHVIESMLRGLGANIEQLQAPFQPEGGAYVDHTHGSRHNDNDHHHE